MNITTLGMDLAKNSFSIVGMNKHGKVLLRKTPELCIHNTDIYPCVEYAFCRDYKPAGSVM